MRVAAFVLMNMCALAFAGCIVSEEAPTAEDEAPAVSPPDWTDLALLQRGDAGDWFWGYQDLPEPTGSHRHTFEMTVDFEAQPDERWAALLWRPSLVINREGDRSLTPYLLSTILWTGPLTIDERWGATASADWPAFETLSFAVAATVPWSYELNLHLGDDDDPSGYTIPPQSVVTGNGTSFALGGEMSPLPLGPYAEMSFAHATAVPGWTQFALLNREVTSTGIQDYDVSFASGETISGRGTSLGGLSLPTWTQFDLLFGELANAAGENSIRTNYVRGVVEQEVLFIHVPGAEEGLPQPLAYTRYLTFGSMSRADTAAGLNIEYERLR